MPVIGLLSSRAPGKSVNVLAAFRQGLSEAGYVEARMCDRISLGGGPLRSPAGIGG